MTETVDLMKLRAPFAPELVGKLPRVTCKACSDGRCADHKKVKCAECGSWISERHIHLDYVGHADVTDRLLSVDPEWDWQPKATDPDPELLRAAVASGSAEIVQAVIGNAPPKFERDRNGSPVGLWIKLTVGGVTRLGVGSCPSGQNDAEKVLIGDALRNAAMRFGVAVDLWAKGDRADPAAENATASAGHASRRGSQSAGDVWESATPAPARQNRGEGNGQHRPAPRPAQDQPQDGEPWLDKATKQAATFTAKETGAQLWREAAERARKGEITGEDAKRIQDLITAQLADLADKPQTLASAARLDPEDNWALKLDEIGDDEDVARTVLIDLARSTVEAAKGHRIRAAITGRFPALASLDELAEAS